MGTVAFADLPTSDLAYGLMYNVSDAFISDERFNDGGGVYYGAGNNVIWVSGDKWDVTAGSCVTGVKGNKETEYRLGNVNITPENIGALPEDGNAVSATKATQDGNGNNIVDTYQTKTGDTNNNTVAYTSADFTSPTEWTDVAALVSGEKHSSILNKISTMFKNIRWLYKMLGTTDISDIGDGTVTGAITGLNNNLNIKINSWSTDSNKYTSIDSRKNENIGRIQVDDTGYLWLGKSSDNGSTWSASSASVGGLALRSGWADWHNDGQMCGSQYIDANNKSMIVVARKGDLVLNSDNGTVYINGIDIINKLNTLNVPTEIGTQYWSGIKTLNSIPGSTRVDFAPLTLKAGTYIVKVAVQYSSVPNGGLLYTTIERINYFAPERTQSMLSTGGDIHTSVTMHINLSQETTIMAGAWSRDELNTTIYGETSAIRIK